MKDNVLKLSKSNVELLDKTRKLLKGRLPYGFMTDNMLIAFALSMVCQGILQRDGAFDFSAVDACSEVSPETGALFPSKDD